MSAGCKTFNFFLLSWFFVMLSYIQGAHLYLLPNVISVERFTPNQEALSLADRTNYHYRNPEGPGTYAFGYDIEDPQTGNSQFRNEERHSDGSVTGSYGYLDPFGIINIVHYIADTRGYRATIERKPPNSLWLKSVPQNQRYISYS